MIIRQCTCRGDRIVIDAKRAHNFIGPGVHLYDCEILIKVGGGAFAVGEAELTRCCVETSGTQLYGVSWCDARLNSCTFSGTFRGNDFGFWRGESEYGSIDSCDFSAARLDGCRFFGVDPGNIKWPDWPGIVVKDPAITGALMRETDTMGDLEVLTRTHEQTPRDVFALAWHAPILVKDLGISERLLAEVLKRSGVLVNV